MVPSLNMKHDQILKGMKRILKEPEFKSYKELVDLAFKKDDQLCISNQLNKFNVSFYSNLISYKLKAFVKGFSKHAVSIYLKQFKPRLCIKRAADFVLNNNNLDCPKNLFPNL